MPGDRPEDRPPPAVGLSIGQKMPNVISKGLLNRFGGYSPFSLSSQKSTTYGSRNTGQDE